MNASITWHGHSNFQIATPSCNIVIDPFFTHNPCATVGVDSMVKPDMVLLTHLHGDHEGDIVAICQKHKAMVGAVVGLGEALIAKGVPAEQIVNGIGFNIGGTISINGVLVTMTEAFHSSEAGVPTGFIITLPTGYTIYHAGDTGVFANMATWGTLYPIDLALLPIGGVFTMDAKQAAYAAKLLGTKAVIPMHYGTFPLLAQNATAFQQELNKTAPLCSCICMQPGQKVALPL